MDDFLERFIWIFLVAFLAAYFAYSVFTKRGKGRLFGGEIIKTFEPMIEKRNGLTTTKIKVYLIKPHKRPQKIDIGIELSNSAMLAWSMTPITLTPAEALQFKGLIERGILEIEELQ